MLKQINKNNKTKILIHMLIAVLLTAAFAVPSAGFAVSEDEPETECRSAVLFDVNTGTILYGKNIEKRMNPASLTKLLTAVVVLDNCDDLSREVEITSEAVGVTGNNMELREGEKLTVRELMDCMLVYSANDAAVALAVDIFGSQDKFTKRMNETAEELGCENSRFISVNGLTNSGRHYVTARDMVNIVREAMSRKVIRDTVKKKSITIDATNLSEDRKYKNTNRMLYDKKTEIRVNGEKRNPKYAGTIGIKTGFMSSSGYCLASCVAKDEGDFAAVVLDAPSDEARYEDSIALLEYGCSKWHSEELFAPGEAVGKVKIKGGHKTRVDGIVPMGAYVTLPKEGDDDLADYEIEMDKGIKAPVKKGTAVGTVSLYEGGEKVGETDIVLSESVEEGWGPWTLLGISDLTMMIVFAVMAVLIIVIIRLEMKAKKKAREAQRRREAERARREREEARLAEEKRRRNWPF